MATTNALGSGDSSRSSEAENQLLIAMLEVEAAHETPNRAKLPRTAGYFRRYLVDWSDAFGSLTAEGLVTEQDGVYALTGSGRAAAEPLRRARPAMWYWYRDYHEATRDSKAYAEYCRRVFGRNFTQHGFADMAQVDRLFEVLVLGPGKRVLDLGYGNSAMADYISDVTGAHVTAIDYVPEAIVQAQERARAGLAPRWSRSRRHWKAGTRRHSTRSWPRSASGL